MNKQSVPSVKAMSLAEIESFLVQVLSNPDEFDASSLTRMDFEKSEQLKQILNIPNIEQYIQDVWKRRQRFARTVFPMTRKLLAPQKFRTIVQIYWCKNPSTNKDPMVSLATFPKFLSDEFPEAVSQFPFLADLADFEYAQMMVWKSSELFPKANFIDLARVQNRKNFAPIVNPTLLIKTYEHPVAKMAQLIGSTKRRRFTYPSVPTNLAIYQEPETGSLRVQQMGEKAANLMELAQSQPASYLDLLERACGASLNNSISSKAVELFKQMEKTGIFVGARKCSPS